MNKLMNVFSGLLVFLLIGFVIAFVISMFAYVLTPHTEMEKQTFELRKENRRLETQIREQALYHEELTRNKQLKELQNKIKESK